MARMTPTWVYAITCGDHTKIGIATDVAKRAKGLQGSNPLRVAVHGTKLFADYSVARQIEADLHAEFAEYRGYGEWFHVSPERVMESLSKRHAPEKRPSEPDRHPAWTDSQWRMAKALQF